MNVTMAPADQISSNPLKRRYDSLHTPLRLRKVVQGRQGADDLGRRGEVSSTSAILDGEDGKDDSGTAIDPQDDSVHLTISTPAHASMILAARVTNSIPFITTTPGLQSPSNAVLPTTFPNIPMLTVWPPPVSFVQAASSFTQVRQDSSPDVAVASSTKAASIGLTTSDTEGAATTMFSVATITQTMNPTTTKQPFSLPSGRANETNHRPPFSSFPSLRSNRALSPLAENLLISLGSIGAFIILCAGVFFFLRMRKRKRLEGDTAAFNRTRKFQRGGSRGWYGWRKPENDYAAEPPPKYSAEVFQHKTMSMNDVRPSYSSVDSDNRIATPLSVTDLGDTGREGLLKNASPFEKAPVVVVKEVSATEAFYGSHLRNAPLIQQSPVHQVNSNTQRGPLSRQTSGTETHGTAATAKTNPVDQTSMAHNTSQQEEHRLSRLSSISSGFGDGLIIPDSTAPVKEQPENPAQSQSTKPTRFSWLPSEARDTIYTTSSIDTAPRFRSVNSWVAQQTGRVERKAQGEQRVPNVPSLPAPLQAGLPMKTPLASHPIHQRKRSEDPRFNFHPGDEVEISRGSRVPSVILDKTLNGKGLRLSRDDA